MEAESPHEWKKRRKTMTDWINIGASWVAIVGGTAAALGWALDAVPFVKAQVYSADKSAIDGRVANLEGQFRTMSSSVQNIQRNGILSLQLQLKQRLDVLMATLATTPRAAPNYFALQNEVNTLQQQLDEVTRQLNR